MGSNGIRLVAAEFISPSTYTELFYERVPVRLGHAVYYSGRLDSLSMDAAVRAMVRFRDILTEYRIEHHRVVSTSAVRESENGNELIDRIMAETSLAVEPINGAEEARLVYWAIKDRIALGKHPWVMADLGGGSLEVALVDDSGLLAVESHTIGSVRLLERFQASVGDTRRFHTLIDEYLSGLRTLAAAPKPPNRLIATGGNIEDLAGLAGAQPDEHGVSHVELDALAHAIERLANLSVDERIEKLALRPDRADVVLPAAMVYQRLASVVGADTIHVPFVGVKEGVMLDLVEGLVAHTGYTERHAQDVLAGAVALGRRFSFNEAHGVHVARLATSLFDQLTSIHDLSHDAREILLAAAVLHDVGQQISYKRHHKHAQYLISQSEIPGLSTHNLDLASQVARYHRKAHPTDGDPTFAALADDDRGVVTKLAGILRLADAMDREHRQLVQRVTATATDGVLRLQLHGEGDLTLERWALEKKADLFVAAFQKDVRL